MTGRAAGFCAGNAVSGFACFGGGRGRGMGGGGFGRGFGRGRIEPAVPAGAPTGAQELAVLKQQARQLQADLELIQGRIQELESKPERP